MSEVCHVAVLSRSASHFPLHADCISLDLLAQDGDTALLEAALAGDVAIVRYLVDHGADIHAARDGVSA
jgi:ankyrin repeat protein